MKSVKETDGLRFEYKREDLGKGTAVSILSLKRSEK